MAALLLALAAPVASPASAGWKPVAYRGVSFTVPAAWPVEDLAADPRRCVRFDVHAVYLGAAAEDQRCPAHLVGVTVAVHVEPLDARAAERAALAKRGTQASGQTVRLLDGLGLLVTVTHGADPELAERILASLRATGPEDAQSSALSLLGGEPPAENTRFGRATVTGEGFDACSAPSARTMRAWLRSPYRSVGVYIGGSARACSQPNLVPSWVAEVTGLGWSLIPTYVGRQAPCTRYGSRIDPARAAAQGRAAAEDAAARAEGLGFGAGSPLYFDMEAYNNRRAFCVRAVNTFLDAWTRELHARGYASGVYGSSGSTIRELSRRYDDPAFARPDYIWFGRWNREHTVWGDPSFPDSQWADHQRIHQYAGGHRETHGGVTLNIDGNYLDGAVVGGPAIAPPADLDAAIRATGDFDGDRRSDVAALHRRADGGVNLWVFLSRAAGPAEPALVRTLYAHRGGWSWDAIKAVAGDFNGDQRSDLALLHRTGDGGANLWVLTSTGLGFADPVNVWHGGDGWSWNAMKLAVGDANGDLRSDLLALHRTAEGFDLWVFPAILGAPGSSAPSRSRSFRADQGWSWEAVRPVAADVNGDLWSDLVLARDDSDAGSSLWVLASAGIGFAEPVRVWRSDAWRWDETKLAAGDVDGDRRSDLAALARRPDGGADLWVFPSGATPSTTPALVRSFRASAGGWRWDAIKTVGGDFDGDLRSDLALLHRTRDGSANLWVLPSAGSGFGDPLNVWRGDPGAGWRWDAMKLA